MPQALGVLTDRHWETEEVILQLSQQLPEFPAPHLIQVWDEKSRHRLMLMERRHEQTFWMEGYGQFWSSMSSGEKKLRWIEHALAKKPTALYIEYPWAHLDPEKINRLSEILALAHLNTWLICAWPSSAEIPSWITRVIDLRSTKNQCDPLLAVQQDFPVEDKPISEKYDTALVSLKQVSVSYGDKPVLDRVNWTILPRQIWALKGPNGSGKSTLIELITADNPKGYNQNVTLFGQPKGKGVSVWDIKKKIGYYTPSQLDYFHQQATVEEMIIGGLKDQVGLYELPSSSDRQKAAVWIQWAGLEPQKNKIFLDCSPGIQALIMTVRALVKMPPLLILDEAHAAMDQSTISWWISLLAAVKRKTSMSIVLVSHDLTPAVVDHIITLHPSSTGSTSTVEHL